MSGQDHYDVIVIGAGASGMIAAGCAAERGRKVLLIEKNKRFGEKLRITGGGRCNITNAELNNRLLLKQYGKSEQFLYSLFSQFSVKDTFEFFESRGLPLVIEARNRAFPASHKAQDVVETLEKYLTVHRVACLRNMAVKKVLHSGSTITGVLVKDGTTYTADSYIIATGSISHPETGSTGDGFSWLSNTTHTVIQPTPDIVPIKTDNEWIKSLTGTKLTDIKITFYSEEEKQFSLTGTILCTHFGLSGPLILNNSSRISDLLQAGAVTAEVDLYPALDYGALERQLLQTFDTNKNKDLKNILNEISPAGTKRGVQVMVESFIDGDIKVHSISKEQRKKLAQILKSMPVSVVGLMGFEKAVIADGGMDIKEVDFRTMRSKKVANLFVTGDLLHINRPSGGYSLQLCWSTGYVAGSNA